MQEDFPDSDFPDPVLDDMEWRDPGQRMEERIARQLRAELKALMYERDRDEVAAIEECEQLQNYQELEADLCRRLGESPSVLPLEMSSVDATAALEKRISELRSLIEKAKPTELGIHSGDIPKANEAVPNSVPKGIAARDGAARRAASEQDGEGKKAEKKEGRKEGERGKKEGRKEGEPEPANEAVRRELFARELRAQARTIRKLEAENAELRIRIKELEEGRNEEDKEEGRKEEDKEEGRKEENAGPRTRRRSTSGIRYLRQLDLEDE